MPEFVLRLLFSVHRDPMATRVYHLAARSILLSAALTFGCIATGEVADAQVVKRMSVKWISPTTEILRLPGYEVKEMVQPNGLRRDYIKRGTDREWIPFYAHERFLLVTLGHRERLVLINDCPATKFCKVAVSNLSTGKVSQIDQRALNMYRRNAGQDNRLIIVPQAHAFSPDDRQVLINMELIYVSVPVEPKGVAERLQREYRNWWYVVDSKSGRVLREFRTSKIPRRWWSP